MSIRHQKRMQALTGALPASAFPLVVSKTRQVREKPVWRPMDGVEWRAIQALSHVTFLPRSVHKRVAQNLAHQLEIVEITDKQAAYLWALVWRYRRQIPAADLVEHARRTSTSST